VEALPWYSQAIDTLSTAIARRGSDFGTQQFLRNSHVGRAMALAALGRHAEAALDYGRAAELDGGPRRTDWSLERGLGLARAGLPAKAASEAEELLHVGKLDAWQLYDAACVFGLCAGGQPAAREQHAARAIELLRQAVAKGYKNVAHMKKDSDLDALRGRADFQQLLAELEAKKP
jgi:eukaryotic-like serine/threonine-protein kinase